MGRKKLDDEKLVIIASLKQQIETMQGVIDGQAQELEEQSQYRREKLFYGTFSGVAIVGNRIVKNYPRTVFVRATNKMTAENKLQYHVRKHRIQAPGDVEIKEVE